MPTVGESLSARIPQVSLARLEADVRELASIPSRHVNSDGVRQAAEFLAESFRQAGGSVVVEEDLFRLEFGGVATDQRNIVARIPGWDETTGALLIGAHYDSRSTSIEDWASPAPGASDNASGVAALLEIARLLADFRPRSTILLVAFSAEETGLHGSRHYVSSGMIEQENLRAMIALDIIGNSAGQAGAGSLRVFAGGGPASSSSRLATWLGQIASGDALDLEVLVQDRLDRPGRFSDHVPFFEAGVPAVRLTEGLERTELQHNAGDVADLVDFDYLARATRLVLAAIVRLSEDPEPSLGPTPTP